MSVALADVAITFGRNEHGVPLSNAQWQTFKDCILGAVKRSNGDVWACNDGVGQWQGESEGNCVVTATVPAGEVATLRCLVKGIGQGFNQDAIAFLVGRTELIYSEL